MVSHWPNDAGRFIEQQLSSTGQRAGFCMDGQLVHGIHQQRPRPAARAQVAVDATKGSASKLMRPR